MYNEQLATKIFQKLDDAFPKKMQFDELRASLNEFSVVPEEDWLTAIDALHKYGRINCVALRSGFQDVLQSVANLEVTEVGRKELRGLRHTVAASRSESNLLFL